MDWDPDDPDTVKVHYDVAGWDFDQRARLAEVLAESELPHTWDADELVVPEAIEAVVDGVFDRLEHEIGPFAVAPDEAEPVTEFGLDDWPAADLGVLRVALVESQIPHRWDGTTVFVATDAEDVVDDLLDAIERGDVANFSDDDTAPDDALGRLYGIGDRLARDPADGGARRELFDLVELLDPGRPPFGVAARTWSRVVEVATLLGDGFSDEAYDAGDLAERAAELRSVTRPYV